MPDILHMSRPTLQASTMEMLALQLALISNHFKR
jgi:hypothetical protein